MSVLSDEKSKVLKEVFGYSSFRPAQSQVIDNILAGRDVLAVMPTGAGKSLCFQIPAIMSDGITLVISPLISLMTDQVNALVQSGVRAAYYNSSLTPAQQRKVRENIAAGIYKIVYVSPERLDTDSFVSLAHSIDISMLAVDEAHCISQWGQDFRPSYLNIVKFAASLPCRPIISAFTATATEAVKEDIVKILSLNDPYCITTGFDRPNLCFGVEHPKDKYKALTAHLAEYNGKSGIIYCSTRKNVESVAIRLVKDGYSAAPYHAGLSDEQRKKNQEDFLYDRVRIIVATNAFGMGIDKSNVSFVIHYNMPKDMESYYQEAGRAGRDGEPADCIILYSGSDYGMARFMINSDSSDNPDLDESARKILIKRDMKRLDFMFGYCSSDLCLRKKILGYFGESAPDECGNCSVCLDDSSKTDITVDSQKIMSCIFRMGQNYGISMVSMVLRGKTNERISALGFDSLTTFGILRDTSEKRVNLLINRLIGMNYITKTDDDFPVLKLTPKSSAVLKGKETIETFIPADTGLSRREKKSLTEQYAIDPVLMSALKELRRKISEEKGIPSYTVFTDATLRDMCVRLPRSRTEMLSVSGVGSKKLDSYGDAFLEVIQKRLSESDNGIRKLSDEEKKAASDPLAAVSSAVRKYSPSDNLTITSFCGALIDLTGLSIPNKPVREAVYKWLISHGYLTETQDKMGKNCKTVTDTSADIGIVKEIRSDKSGREYERILYTPAAQKFILDNFSEISKV